MDSGFTKWLCNTSNLVSNPLYDGQIESVRPETLISFSSRLPTRAATVVHKSGSRKR